MTVLEAPVVTLVYTVAEIERMRRAAPKLYRALKYFDGLWRKGEALDNPVAGDLMEEALCEAEGKPFNKYGR